MAKRKLLTQLTQNELEQLNKNCNDLSNEDKKYFALIQTDGYTILVFDNKNQIIEELVAETYHEINSLLLGYVLGSKKEKN